MNQEAVAANECAGETGLISFGAIHPDTPDYKEVLSWLADHDVRGIKLHPDYQGTFFDDIRMERIVDKATELGLYTVVHGGIDIGLPDPIHCTPARTVKVLQDTETDKLIVAHMGGWTLWDEVEELLIGRNVYLDTSFSIDCLEGVQGLLNKERFTRMVRDHGADRDLVWARIVRGVTRSSPRNGILHTDLTGEEKEKILGENARKLLGFSCKMER